MILVKEAHSFGPSNIRCDNNLFWVGTCGLSFAGGGFSNALNYGSD